MLVVTDGFTGNMVLKTIEGTASGIFTMLKEAFNLQQKQKFRSTCKRSLRGLKNKMDYYRVWWGRIVWLKSTCY